MVWCGVLNVWCGIEIIGGWESYRPALARRPSHQIFTHPHTHTHTCAGMYAVCRPSHREGSTPSASAISGSASDSRRTRIRYSSAVSCRGYVYLVSDQQVSSSTNQPPTHSIRSIGRTTPTPPHLQTPTHPPTHIPEAGGSPRAARARTASTSSPDSDRSTGSAGSSMVVGLYGCTGM